MICVKYIFQKVLVDNFVVNLRRPVYVYTYSGNIIEKYFNVMHVKKLRSYAPIHRRG